MSAKAERFRKIKEVFLTAADLRPSARSSYLDEACEGDHSLRVQVERLLAREAEDSDFLEHSAAEMMGLVEEEPATLPHGREPAPTEDPRFQGWERYELIERIGRGGMGEVYTAHDPRLKRVVAIKFVRHDNEQQENRFRREAEAHARVDHDHVVKVYETGRLGDSLYLAMQYIDGPTLMGVRYDTTLEQKVRLLRQVADGIHAAHREGLVHRDVKPSNILIETGPDGELRPYITDFGLAADLFGPGITATGEMMGTPTYMAPERVQPGDFGAVDRRTDVYSLGATLFEFLLGRPPFEADSTLGLLLKIQKEDPIPPRRIDPHLPVELEAILMRCLEKEPEHRYPSARALAEDLDRYLDGEPVEAGHTTLVYRFKKKVRKHRNRFAVAGLVLVLLTVASVWGFFTKLDARRQTLAAQALAREQARVVRELGHQVIDLEYQVRVAHLAPLHDVRIENKSIREKLTRLAERFASENPIVQGPLQAAVGQVELALFDYEAARESLESAWELEFQEDSVAYALGKTLGAIYEREAALARQIDNQRLRENRIELLKEQLLEPAIEHLKQGREAALDAPEFVTALIASYQERFDVALDRTAALDENLSWQYEARKLEGDIHLLRGDQLRDTGRYEEAAGEYQEAESAYLAALDVARSDVRLYEGLCRLEDSRMEMADLRQQELRGWFESGELWCNRAVRVDPERGLAYRLLASLFTRHGKRSDSEQEVEQALERAAIHAREAIELSQEDPDALRALGLALTEQARFDVRRQLDPRPAVDEAVTAFEAANELPTKLAVSYIELAEVIGIRYSYETEQGLDPRESLQTATRALEGAIELNPELQRLHARIAPLHGARARWENERGLDPRSSALSAVASYELALTANPGWIAGQQGLDTYRTLIAEWEPRSQ